MTAPLNRFSETTADPTSLYHDAELAQLRARVSELEQESTNQKWINTAFNAVAFSTTTATGKEFLQALVQQLSCTLNVQYAFVTEWAPGRTDRLRLVAGWEGDRASGLHEYDLSGSPCHRVMQDGAAFFPRNLCQLFPQDTYLSSLKIESYMGVTLFGAGGRPTGHLCVMDTNPFSFDDSRGLAIIRAFAGRAAAELERLRAEETLKANDQRYQFLYENNPSMYFTLSPEGTVLSVNHYGADQLGYSQEELTGHSILRVFDARDHQTVIEQLGICASNPAKLFHWEIQKIRKSGVRLWVREHALAIQDETGTTVILIVCEDITAHKQVELRLQKINECFLRFGSDPLANINRLTALGGELLGGTCALYSRLEGTVLRSIGQWQAPSDFNPVDQADGHLCADLIKKGDDHLCTIRHLANTSYVRTDPNVSRYQLQTYVGQIVTRGKNPIGSLCVLFQHDFVPTEADEGLMGILASAIETEEERMQAQEALRTSEVQWRQFVADAPVGLVIMDNQQRLLSANKTFCDLTGYSEREVVGNTYALYTHPDDLPDNLILTNAFFEDTRSSYTYEKRYIRKTGDIIWVAVTTTGIELPGHTGPLMLAVVEDISERKRVTEERERISQDLHDDVLQSLYAVGMGLEHMRQRISRISPTNARRLDGSVTQLNAVICQVRSFIPRMQMPAIQQGAFDQALLAIVQSLTVAGAGDIELAIDKSVADGLSRTQCGPVLSIAKEALSNSLRHAGAAHRRITVQLYRGKFRLEVFDDGKGFSPTARKSSGMGLANMRARARKLGARLTIRSRPKKGTQVVLDIPMPAPDHRIVQVNAVV